MMQKSLGRWFESGSKDIFFLYQLRFTPNDIESPKSGKFPRAALSLRCALAEEVTE